MVRKHWLSEDTEIQIRIKTWAEGQGLPFLDLTSTLRKAVRQGMQLTFELDGHLNALGHEEVSLAIASWLSGQHVFPNIQTDNSHPTTKK